MFFYQVPFCASKESTVCADLVAIATYQYQYTSKTCKSRMHVQGIHRLYCKIIYWCDGFWGLPPGTTCTAPGSTDSFFLDLQIFQYMSQKTVAFQKYPTWRFIGNLDVQEPHCAKIVSTGNVTSRVFRQSQYYCHAPLTAGSSRKLTQDSQYSMHLM